MEITSHIELNQFHKEQASNISFLKELINNLFFQFVFLIREIFFSTTHIAFYANYLFIGIWINFEPTIEKQFIV